MPNFGRILLKRASYLANKFNPVSIVTGASSNIGARMAITLANRYRSPLLLHSQPNANQAELEKVAQECIAAGSKVELCQADLTTEKGRAEIIDSTLTRFDRLDALFNSARIKPEANMSFSKKLARHYMLMNAIGPIALARQAIPFLQQSKQGFICSVACEPGIHGHTGSLEQQANACYVPSMQYLVENSNAMATEYAGKLRICTLCPEDVDLTPDDAMPKFLEPEDINDFSFDDCFPETKTLTPGDLAFAAIKLFESEKSNGVNQIIAPSDKYIVYAADDIPEPYRSIYLDRVMQAEQQINSMRSGNY